MFYVFMTMPSPVGTLQLVASARGLAGILWENDRPERTPHLTGATPAPDHPVLHETRRQLDAYFAGTHRIFDLPLDLPQDGFQGRVWQELLSIPYGETRTYGQIAKHLGSPGASRAVGAANGRNPISIVAPCHRVVGSNGKLTGFAGGLDVKARLLRLERGDLFVATEPRFRFSTQTSRTS